MVDGSDASSWWMEVSSWWMEAMHPRGGWKQRNMVPQPKGMRRPDLCVKVSRQECSRSGPIFVRRRYTRATGLWLSRTWTRRARTRSSSRCAVARALPSSFPLTSPSPCSSLFLPLFPPLPRLTIQLCTCLAGPILPQLFLNSRLPAKPVPFPPPLPSRSALSLPALVFPFRPRFYSLPSSSPSFSHLPLSPLPCLPPLLTFALALLQYPPLPLFVFVLLCAWSCPTPSKSEPAANPPTQSPPGPAAADGEGRGEDLPRRVQGLCVSRGGGDAGHGEGAGGEERLVGGKVRKRLYAPRMGRRDEEAASILAVVNKDTCLGPE